MHDVVKAHVGKNVVQGPGTNGKTFGAPDAIVQARGNKCLAPKYLQHGERLVDREYLHAVPDEPFGNEPGSCPDVNSELSRLHPCLGCLLYTSDAADDLLCVD